MLRGSVAQLRYIRYVRGAAAAVYEVYLPVKTAVRDFADHAEKRSDTAAARKQDLLFAVVYGVIVDMSGGRGGREYVAYLHIVMHEVRHKAALLAAHSYLIVAALLGRG